MLYLTIQPYLFFGGRCEEALEFYRNVLGARTELLIRYSESPEPPPAGMLPPGFENKIMHSAFRIGETTVMASDGWREGQCFEGFSLSLAVSSEAEAKHIFTALADGGRIDMPLGETFWSPCFGMVTDRFGVSWMVGILS